MHLKMSSGKRRPFCLSLNVLINVLHVSFPRSSYKGAVALGSSFSVSQGLYYCGFAAAFYLGAHLIRDGDEDFTEVFTWVRTAYLIKSIAF